MIPSHRRRFNQDYSEAKYARFLALLEERCGEPVPFRHSETPCFLPGSLIDTMARYGREMVEQLLANPQYERESRAAIPAENNVPGEDAVPMFVQADFGLDAQLRPQSWRSRDSRPCTPTSHCSRRPTAELTKSTPPCTHCLVG